MDNTQGIGGNMLTIEQYELIKIQEQIDFYKELIKKYPNPDWRKRPVNCHVKPKEDHALEKALIAFEAIYAIRKSGLQIPQCLLDEANKRYPLLAMVEKNYEHLAKYEPDKLNVPQI